MVYSLDAVIQKRLRGLTNKFFLKSYFWKLILNQ